MGTNHAAFVGTTLMMRKCHAVKGLWSQTSHCCISGIKQEILLYCKPRHHHSFQGLIPEPKTHETQIWGFDMPAGICCSHCSIKLFWICLSMLDVRRIEIPVTSQCGLIFCWTYLGPFEEQISIFCSHPFCLVCLDRWIFVWFHNLFTLSWLWKNRQTEDFVIRIPFICVFNCNIHLQLNLWFHECLQCFVFNPMNECAQWIHISKLHAPTIIYRMPHERDRAEKEEITYTWCGILTIERTDQCNHSSSLCSL